MHLQFLCILNAAWIGNVNPIMSSPERLTQKIVSVGTAYICLIYALSTWFYHSNYSEPRQHIRIVVGIRSGRVYPAYPIPFIPFRLHTVSGYAGGSDYCQLCCRRAAGVAGSGLVQEWIPRQGENVHRVRVGL